MNRQLVTSALGLGSWWWKQLPHGTQRLPKRCLLRATAGTERTARRGKEHPVCPRWDQAWSLLSPRRHPGGRKQANKLRGGRKEKSKSHFSCTYGYCSGLSVSLRAHLPCLVSFWSTQWHAPSLKFPPLRQGHLRPGQILAISVNYWGCPYSDKNLAFSPIKHASYLLFLRYAILLWP